MPHDLERVDSAADGACEARRNVPAGDATADHLEGVKERP